MEKDKVSWFLNISSVRLTLKTAIKTQEASEFLGKVVPIDRRYGGSVTYIKIE